ncbi:MAG: ECF transporter S component [Ruminococcaceae bacterium]|nr:ECF transporter S component [Oscillospiraceae bacterium]
MEKNKSKIQSIVVTAILAAIIVVLQTFASGIHIGPFTITLSLVPIVLGAVLYGPFQGAFLGAVFGVVVCVAVVTGADAGGFLMFQELHVLTLFLCVLKSTVAGFVAGLIFKLLGKKNTYVGIAVAAVMAPICNTGILSIGMLLFYRELITGWAIGAGYSSALLYVILGVVGINFIAELVINVVLTPVIVRVIRAVRKSA